MKSFRMYIDGDYTDAAGGEWIDSMSPTGGYRDSGLGRQNGIDAVREYLQVKSVWVNTGAPIPNPYAGR